MCLYPGKVPNALILAHIGSYPENSLHAFVWKQLCNSGIMGFAQDWALAWDADVFLAVYASAATCRRSGDGNF